MLLVDLRNSSYCVTCAFLYSFLNSVSHAFEEKGLISIMGFVLCIGERVEQKTSGNIVLLYSIACGWRLFPHPFTVPQQSSEVLRYGEPIMRDGDIQLSTEAPL